MSRAIVMGRRNSGKRIWRGAVTAAVLTVAVASPAMAEAVGGGTWNHGVTRTSGTHTWSEYYHGVNYHSATSTCGTEYRKVYASAGSWANANTA